MTRTQRTRIATSGTQQARARERVSMDAVEIKVTIRPDQELRAERAMELNEDTAEVRVTYFYDTRGSPCSKRGLRCGPDWSRGTMMTPPSSSARWNPQASPKNGSTIERIQTRGGLCRRPDGLLGIAHGASET